MSADIRSFDDNQTSVAEIVSSVLKNSVYQVKDSSIRLCGLIDSLSLSRHFPLISEIKDPDILDCVEKGVRSYNAIISSIQNALYRVDLITSAVFDYSDSFTYNSKKDDPRVVYIVNNTLGVNNQCVGIIETLVELVNELYYYHDLIEYVITYTVYDQNHFTRSGIARSEYTGYSSEKIQPIEHLSVPGWVFSSLEDIEGRVSDVFY